MSHSTVVSSKPRRRTGDYEGALAAVARQEAEHDFRRRRLFIVESRTSAALHVDKLSSDSAIYPKSSSPELEAAHQFADEAAREAASAHGDLGLVHELIRARSQPVAGDRKTIDVMMAATMPFVASSASAQPTPTASVMIESLSQAERNSITATTGDRLTHNVRSQDVPTLDVANDTVVQLALAQAAALTGGLDKLAPADGNPGSEARSLTPLTDTVTSEQVDSLSPRAVDWWEHIRNTSQGRERDEGIQARRILAQRAIAGRSESTERDVASIFGGAIESLSGKEMRSDFGSSYSPIDRDGGSNSVDRPESGTAIQSPVDESMAAAAQEIERLRTAVRQSIDELERVRGSVHPPLPALPVNRGSFRMS